MRRQLALEQQGWAVQHDSEDAKPWTATRRSQRIMADDALQLLGLAATRDVRGRAWRASDDQIADVLHRFIWKRRKRWADRETRPRALAYRFLPW